ncbi:unnamed protein product [Nippostrongylus brasiliensis]|uniref:Probable adenylate kinase isoenzyme (inferred by orthology to a C. elegans protein) n=1 Tax=Nippostrongylus brasiliensis TaxID=27835 RepID=A0A0N4YBL4_NIPBR|nr:unnamed protein product [Nippostrongylus brasiliensis]
MFRVLLSGPAGCGKHTVAKMLMKEFDEFRYFSAGDFIRDHIQRGTGMLNCVENPYIARAHQRPTKLREKSKCKWGVFDEFGQRAASFLRKGELIPDSIVNDVLFQEIRRRGSKLILDGS